MKKYFLAIVALIFFFAGCRSTILQDPSTLIQYSLQQTAHVRLAIENSYNTVVATPVDTIQQAGIHAVSLDMGVFPEGIYFYTLEFRGIGNGYYYKATKSLVLLK
jgi:PBP1b-binding outer membrane lipoprotein LpoB